MSAIHFADGIFGVTRIFKVNESKAGRILRNPHVPKRGRARENQFTIGRGKGEFEDKLYSFTNLIGPNFSNGVCKSVSDTSGWRSPMYTWALGLSCRRLSVSRGRRRRWDTIPQDILGVPINYSQSRRIYLPNRRCGPWVLPHLWTPRNRRLRTVPLSTKEGSKHEREKFSLI